MVDCASLADCIEAAELRGRSLKDILTREERRVLVYALRNVRAGGPMPTKGGPTELHPDAPYCKPDQSCCDFCCGN